MPSSLKQAKFYVTEQELLELQEHAVAAGLTLSTYLRRRCKLKPLKRGAQKGNQRAIGNPGRWKKET